MKLNCIYSIVQSATVSDIDEDGYIVTRNSVDSIRRMR
jgi:hypothetical protein